MRSIAFPSEGQPFSPRSSTVLQGGFGNFRGLFDCHSLGMGAPWAFIRLGGEIRDDMFWALHNKATPCLKHPVSRLRSTADLVFLVLGGAASTPKDEHVTQSWPMREFRLPGHGHWFRGGHVTLPQPMRVRSETLLELRGAALYSHWGL